MNSVLRHKITEALQARHGSEMRIAAIMPAGGSSFSSTAKLTLQSGELLFVKYAINPPPGIFHSECEALRLLHDAHALRVPEPLCNSNEFIVTRWIEFGSKAPDWHEAFGHGLALLHRARQSSRYGFGHDNYLGTSPQPNGWRESWLEFWREHRLGAQLAMWRRYPVDKDKLAKLGERLLDRLDVYLDAVREPGVLLHGDLWSGNAAADRDGKPVIYDPASYTVIAKRSSA